TSGLILSGPRGALQNGVLIPCRNTACGQPPFCSGLESMVGMGWCAMEGGPNAACIQSFARALSGGSQRMYEGWRGQGSRLGEDGGGGGAAGPRGSPACCGYGSMGC